MLLLMHAAEATGPRHGSRGHQQVVRGQRPLVHKGWWLRVQDAVHVLLRRRWPSAHYYQCILPGLLVVGLWGRWRWPGGRRRPRLGAPHAAVDDSIPSILSDLTTRARLAGRVYVTMRCLAQKNVRLLRFGRM